MTIYMTPDEARAIARDAYTYGFPLVNSYRILWSYYVDAGGPHYKGPWNQIEHSAQIDRRVPKANVDMLQSDLGLDLRAEPFVLSVPDVDDGRYYSIQIDDLYTHLAGHIGTRTTGNRAGDYLVAGPSWHGHTPRQIKAVIHCETELVAVSYCTQLLGRDDLANVERIRAGYHARPLSAFRGKPPEPAPDISFPRPLTFEDQRTSIQFFDELNFVLRLCHIWPADGALMNRFGKLSIGPDKTFSASAFNPEMRRAIEAGQADAWEIIAGLEQHVAPSLKDHYVYRMLGATDVALGKMRDEPFCIDYAVDANGERLDAAKHRYTFHVAPDDPPPVRAFWSLTMYDADELLVDNPLERHAVSTPMLRDLERDPDGGFTLYVQREPPGEHVANWLPAPDGPFVLGLRLYWPKHDALNGTWIAPALQRAA
jgi:hypothetical protein